MNKTLSVLVLSCDKNIDLAPWVSLTCAPFLNMQIPCYVTNELGSKIFYDERISVVNCGDKGFDERFKTGLSLCNADYVLVLLDDYFVHDSSLERKLDSWLSVLREEGLDALRICSLKKWFVKKRAHKDYACLRDPQPYEIDFHPTIWKKRSLESLISSRSFSPWSLEPLFSLFLKDKKCGVARQKLVYDELIIQGHFFKKPYKKFCKKVYSGSKKVIPLNKVASYRLQNWALIVSPYWLIKAARKMKGKKSIASKARL